MSLHAGLLIGDFLVTAERKAEPRNERPLEALALSKEPSEWLTATSGGLGLLMKSYTSVNCREPRPLDRQQKQREGLAVQTLMSPCPLPPIFAVPQPFLCNLSRTQLLLPWVSKQKCDPVFPQLWTLEIGKLRKVQ